MLNHGIKIEETKHTFQDENSFQKWKKDIENDTQSQFVMRYTRDQQRERKYGCHRSGIYVSKAKGLRRLKTQGSKKIDGLCPAAMTALRSAEGIRVKYVHTHVGHDSESDFRYLSLSQSVREEVVKKLKQNISRHTILEDIRISFAGKVQRDHIITLKDIDNIASKHNITIMNEGKRDYSAITVLPTIDEFEKEANSLILFYKPRDTRNELHPFLKNNDFVLIVMNLAQADALKTYGNEVICIHGTPGLGEDDFNLFSLVVLDDLHEAFPCSFLISNRKDNEIFSFFYKKIQDVVGNINPKIFMSDMADELYNSWINVMGPVEVRLYCSWNVDKAWRDHLKNIKNTEKRKNIHQYLQTIWYELDENKFVDLLEEAIDLFQTEEYFEDFGMYFVQNYAKTTKHWAYCYRKNAVINTTNTSIERMHKKIKYLYLKGKEVGSLDQAVGYLIRFIRDLLFDRLTVLYKKKISQKMKILRRRHADWKTVQVTCESDDLTSFLVTSNDKKTYRVVRNITKCNCKMYCSDCHTCIHKYLCTCSDNAVEWNMCRHIHAVCQSIRNSDVTTVEYVNECEDLSENITVIDFNIDEDLMICDELPVEEIVQINSIDEKSPIKLNHLMDETPAVNSDISKENEEIVKDEKLRAVFDDILHNAKTKTSRAEFLQVLNEFRENLYRKNDSFVVNEEKTNSKIRR